MYKFNFLKEINQEKAIKKKSEKFVQFVFFASLFGAVSILVIMYFLTTGLNDKYESLDAGIKKFTKKHENLRKSKDYFKDKDFKVLYDLYEKRIVWRDVINAVFTEMEPSFVIEKMVYNGDDLLFNFNMQGAGNLSVSSVLKEVGEFRERLLNSKNLVKYLRESEEGKDDVISMVGNPSGKEAKGKKKSLWSFSLNIKLKQGLKLKKEEETSRRRRRKRF